MIKFTSEAVTDKVLKGLGFSEENEEVTGNPSLNCNLASQELRPIFVNIVIGVPQIVDDI
jgi:hypothetical protein